MRALALNDRGVYLVDVGGSVTCAVDLKLPGWANVGVHAPKPPGDWTDVSKATSEDLIPQLFKVLNDRFAERQYVQLGNPHHGKGGQFSSADDVVKGTLAAIVRKGGLGAEKTTEGDHTAYRYGTGTNSHGEAKEVRAGWEQTLQSKGFVKSSKPATITPDYAKNDQDVSRFNGKTYTHPSGAEAELHTVTLEGESGPDVNVIVKAPTSGTGNQTFDSKGRDKSGNARYSVTRANGYNKEEAIGHSTSLAAAKNIANDNANRTGQRNVVHDHETHTIVHDSHKIGRGDQVYHGPSMKGEKSWFKGPGDVKQGTIG